MVRLLASAQRQLIEHARQMLDETVQRTVNRASATGKPRAKVAAVLPGLAAARISSPAPRVAWAAGFV